MFWLVGAVHSGATNTRPITRPCVGGLARLTKMPAPMPQVLMTVLSTASMGLSNPTQTGWRVPRARK